MDCHVILYNKCVYFRSSYNRKLKNKITNYWSLFQKYENF